jgi:hypothetical protein
MMLTRKLALGVAGVVAAGVLGTAGVAAATSETSTPNPAASSAPSNGGTAGSTDKSSTDKSSTDKSTGRKHKARRAAIARGLHGEWVVKGKDGKPVTLVTIRGQVTAVGPASVTVKAEDGFTETFTVNSDTKVRGADVTSIAGVKVGAKGAVVGVKSGNTTTARAVLVRR